MIKKSIHLIRTIIISSLIITALTVCSFASSGLEHGVVSEDVTVSSTTTLNSDLYVERGCTLTVTGKLTVKGNLYLFGDLKNSGEVVVTGTLNALHYGTMFSAGDYDYSYITGNGKLSTNTLNITDNYLNKSIPAAVHEFGEWITIREATANEEGLKERICTICGKKENEVIERITTPDDPTDTPAENPTDTPDLDTPTDSTSIIPAPQEKTEITKDAFPLNPSYGIYYIIKPTEDLNIGGPFSCNLQVYREVEGGISQIKQEVLAPYFEFELFHLEKNQTYYLVGDGGSDINTYDCIKLTLDANGGCFKRTNTKTIASYVPKDYLLTHDFLNSLYVDANHFEVPLWERHTNSGWNTKPDGTGFRSNEYEQLSKDITFYAMWRKEITVTFDANTGSFRGSIVDPDTDDYVKTSTIDLSMIENDPDNGVQLGWYYDANGCYRFTSNDSISCNSVLLPINTSYELKEWNTSSDGSGKSYQIDEAGMISVYDDVTLYAIWGSKEMTDNSSLTHEHVLALLEFKHYGNIWHCSQCGNYYLDKDGLQEHDASWGWETLYSAVRTAKDALENGQYPGYSQKLLQNAVAEGEAVLDKGITNNNVELDYNTADIISDVLSQLNDGNSVRRQLFNTLNAYEMYRDKTAEMSSVISEGWKCANDIEATEDQMNSLLKDIEIASYRIPPEDLNDNNQISDDQQNNEQKPEDLNGNNQTSDNQQNNGTDVSNHIGTPEIKLSATEFAYKYKVQKIKVKKKKKTVAVGTIQKPSVASVKLNGNVLKAGTDYDVAYSNKESADIGTYSVTVTLKGAYSGKGTATYTINPKAVNLKKAAKGKKSFTASWKKLSKNDIKYKVIGGYQLRYSTDPAFPEDTTITKTIKAGNIKSTKKAVKKLQAKTTYYVQLRTYKSVRGVTYCSNWSPAKKVVTK